MRGLWQDRRGVTVQVGAILLFGILIIALATYQAVAVPAGNEGVEFNHNQAVQQDMLDLRNALGEATGGRDPSSVTVRLGTTYPIRVLFVNPAPPGGRLATGPPRTTRLSNVAATNAETDDFLGVNYTVDSRSVTYDPSYNVYDEAPTTALEGPVAVNRGQNRSVAVSGQRLVKGRTISLVVVRGELSRAGSRTLTVDPQRVSETTRTEVTNRTAGNLTLTIPTSLPAGAWGRLLSDEPAVTGVAPAGPNAVNVSLAGVTPGAEPYSLRVGVVDVSGGVPTPAPRYVTSPDAPSATLAPGDEVVVEVRDRYNNPAVGELNVTSGTGLLAGDDDATPTTYEPADREDGVYRLRYVGGDGVIRASLPNATSAEENVTVVVTEVSGPNGGGNVTIETILDDSFESGLGNWSANSEGNVGTAGKPRHLGSRSAVINGDPTGRLVSDDLDTSEASYLEVEYWAYRTEGPEINENEDLRLQYQRADGSWKTIDVIRLRDADGSGDPDPRSFSRRLLVSDDAALRDNVRFRFTVEADAGSDAWYVDDVRIYGIGGGSGGGGGGGSTAADSVATSGTASFPNGGSELVFDLENTGSSGVTLSNVSVTVSGGSAKKVGNPGGDEVSGGGGAVTSPFDLGTTVAFGTDPTIGAGATETFTIGQFRQNGNNNPVDVSGRTIDVTIGYADGSTETYTLNPP